MAEPTAQQPRPWRTGLPDRPALEVPPRAPWLGRRPLKRWRWVGCFTDELMLCAAVAHVGPVPVAWWAVWERDARILAERTVRRRGVVRLDDSRVRVHDGPVRIDLVLDEQPGVETISPHGPAGWAWTRKQGGIGVTGAVRVADRDYAVDARGMVDDSAGYHARRTDWCWSAGVGVSASGTPVAWNLVEGLHDAPEASERTVWVDGEPHHVGPVAFAPGLSAVRFADGTGLDFHAEATRTHHEQRLVAASDYEAPFGRFGGRLPEAGEIDGLGVMERHSARW